MSIPFDNVQFPEDIAYGSGGGSGFSTQVIRLPSGQRRNIEHWSEFLGRYDVSMGIKTHGDLASVQNFHRARRGGSRGFRFRDLYDCVSTEQGVHPSFSDDQEIYLNPSATDQPMVAVGSSTTQFQLIKRYGTSDPQPLDKPIRKPRISTILIAEDGVATTSGWTVSTDGIVTFNDAPTNPTWGGYYDIPVVFAEDADALLGATIEDFGSGTIDSISLEEIREDVTIFPDVFYGGASERSIAADYTITITDGLFQLYEATESGLKLILPDPENLPNGRLFVLANHSTGNSLLVRDETDSTTLATLTTGNTTEVFNLKDGAGNNLWEVIA